MKNELRMVFRHFRKSFLLKLFSFMLFTSAIIRNVNPYYACSLLNLCASFFILDYFVNVFGLDYNAFYLRYLTGKSIVSGMIRKLALPFMLQAIVSSIFAVLAYFLFDPEVFQFEVLTAGILLLANLCWGAIASSTLPVYIPLDLRAKAFRVNPGRGFLLGILFDMILIWGACFLFVLSPAKRAEYRHDSVFLIMLLVLLFPLVLRIAGKQLGKNKYKKCISLLHDKM